MGSIGRGRQRAPPMIAHARRRAVLELPGEMLGARVDHADRPTGGHEPRSALRVPSNQRSGLDAPYEPAVLDVVDRSTVLQSAQIGILIGRAARIVNAAHPSRAIHDAINRRADTRPSRRQAVPYQTTDIEPPPPTRTPAAIIARRGDHWVERILSVTETCRLQGRSKLAYLIEAVTAAHHGQPAPSLLPSPP